MKKAMLQLAILFLALGMVMVLGTMAYGGAVSLLAVGAEAGMAFLIGRLYGCIEREQRRAERRARRDAQVHKAAQLYRAGVRVSAHSAAGAEAAQGKRSAPHLRVA